MCPVPSLEAGRDRWWLQSELAELPPSAARDFDSQQGSANDLNLLSQLPAGRAGD